MVGRLRKKLGRRVFAVHRLDRAVSGILLIAFDPKATARLQQALASDSAIKEYVALVRGRTERSFVCTEALKNASGKMRDAHTDFRTLRRFPWCSLIAARIRTGRRHQIRRHCDRVQHQILGDTSYGKSRLNALYRERYDLQRTFLHARRLCLPSEDLDLRLPIAADLRKTILGLARDASVGGTPASEANVAGKSPD